MFESKDEKSQIDISNMKYSAVVTVAVKKLASNVNPNGNLVMALKVKFINKICAKVCFI